MKVPKGYYILSMNRILDRKAMQREIFRNITLHKWGARPRFSLGVPKTNIKNIRNIWNQNCSKWVKSSLFQEHEKTGCSKIILVKFLENSICFYFFLDISWKSFSFDIPPWLKICAEEAISIRTLKQQWSLVAHTTFHCFPML